MTSTSFAKSLYDPPLLHSIKGYTTTMCENDTIELAKIYDIPQMAAIYRQHNKFGHHCNEGDLLRHLAGKGCPILKSTRDGKINGFLTATQWNATAQVRYMYVAQQRQGIGTHLLDTFVQYAGAMGMNKIDIINCTTEGKGLYTHLGFTMDDHLASADTETYLAQAWRQQGYAP